MEPEEWSEFINKTAKNPEISGLKFRDWQGEHIAKILSYNLDIKEKQEKIKRIVDWPYFGPESHPRQIN